MDTEDQLTRQKYSNIHNHPEELKELVAVKDPQADRGKEEKEKVQALFLNKFLGNFLGDVCCLVSYIQTLPHRYPAATTSKKQHKKRTPVSSWMV